MDWEVVAGLGIGTTILCVEALGMVNMALLEMSVSKEVGF